MINRANFAFYGYICIVAAILFFIAHFLYLIDKCPFGISTVIRVSFIQVILAILAIYFGLWSKTKKAKISIILGIIVLILVALYYIFIIQPCL